MACARLLSRQGNCTGDWTHNITMYDYLRVPEHLPDPLLLLVVAVGENLDVLPDREVRPRLRVGVQRGEAHADTRVPGHDDEGGDCGRFLCSSRVAHAVLRKGTRGQRACRLR